MRPHFARVFVACLLALWLSSAGAEVAVVDETGVTVRLAGPATRIVSLAPHATENLFAIGAGALVVGTVDYSNYPEAAKRIPSIGSAQRADLEALLGLRPDLVVAWASGTPDALIAKIRGLGLPVYLSRPGRIGDVAEALEKLGTLTGRREQARAVARRVRERHAALAARYSARPPVRTFYEIWNRPLMTISGTQIISDALRLCGGDNVFADLAAPAASVSIEAVLAADPEAIVASGMGEARPEWLDEWRRWSGVTAVRRGNLFFVPPDLIQRATPRILDGAEQLCRHLEAARGRRPLQSATP